MVGDWDYTDVYTDYSGADAYYSYSYSTITYEPEVVGGWDYTDYTGGDSYYSYSYSTITYEYEP